MELREWAIRILSADRLEDKLLSPEILTDLTPGSPLRWDEPTRPLHLQFQKRSREEKLPPQHALHIADHRAACLHRFAGHELLAVEIMAFALLAFPEAPATFRRGIAHTLQEEQEHVRLYIRELNRLGAEFGDLPLFKPFWNYTKGMKTAAHYVSIVSLTFEMANLDFAPIYGKAFERGGDQEASALMARILQDEISHVRFGYQWLKQFKAPELSNWEAWNRCLSDANLPKKRARGFFIHKKPRIEAGVSSEWIEELH